MDSRRLRDEWVNKPWPTLRGIRTIDYNNSLVLARAPVEDVARAFAPEAVAWERDVLGRDVTVGREGLFVFRLRGHAWTEVLWGPSLLPPSPLGRGWQQALSRRLGTRVIYYAVTDTCGATGYEFFDAGELLEAFDAEEGKQPRFHSRVRHIGADEITRMWHVTHQFFVNQDAFEPGIEFPYFFNRGQPRPGDRALVQNPGFGLVVGAGPVAVSIPDVERVDYVVF